MSPRRNMRVLWLALLQCLYLTQSCRAKLGLQFPSYDNKDRVIDINARKDKKATKKYDMLCLLYHQPLSTSKKLDKQQHMTADPGGYRMSHGLSPVS